MVLFDVVGQKKGISIDFSQFQLLTGALNNPVLGQIKILLKNL